MIPIYCNAHKPLALSAVRPEIRALAPGEVEIFMALRGWECDRQLGSLGFTPPTFGYMVWFSRYDNGDKFSRTAVTSGFTKDDTVTEIRVACDDVTKIAAEYALQAWEYWEAQKAKGEAP